MDLPFLPYLRSIHILDDLAMDRRRSDSEDLDTAQRPADAQGQCREDAQGTRRNYTSYNEGRFTEIAK